MIDKNSSLDDILEHAWGLLGRGSADAKHPFHYPVMATFNEKSVQQRTVVLRNTERPEGLLITYSDIRTQKITDIQQNGQVNWLFYDHGDKEQIRAKAGITIHNQDKMAQEHWDKIPPESRGDYVGPIKPGSESDSYEPNLPDSFLEKPTEENTAQGFENFCVLVSEVKEMDFLKLMKGGHLRCRFNRQGDTWKRRWVAP